MCVEGGAGGGMGGGDFVYGGKRDNFANSSLSNTSSNMGNVSKSINFQKMAQNVAAGMPIRGVFRWKQIFNMLFNMLYETYVSCEMYV